ncbi:CdaR family transcriptional regulator [Bacillus testis]|uniref:CdaR family transcriptional regulator n=1 Tax=Bacillus testis TaxID=1622072 RepID=UPI00067E9ACD|nr:sugar diacid recognition domain-containing protein [Bacillus testis]
MLLSKSLAKRIVSEVQKLFDEEIIIANTEGLIIASTEDKRIGSFHEGAFLCAQEKKKKVIGQEDEKWLKGVKAGLNLPVFFLKDVIGVIGITGEPHKFLPYGELLRKMTELLIQESYYSEQVQWRARMLESFVYDWMQPAVSLEQLKERAKVLDVNLASDRQIILVQVIKPTDYLFQSLWQLTHLWNDAYKEDILVPWGNDRLLLLHSVHANKEDIYQKAQQLQTYINDIWQVSSSLGIGRAVSSRNLSAGYNQAEKALKAANPNKQIVCEEDLRIELCLGDIHPSTREDFTRRILQQAITEPELLITVRAYYKNNMSVKKTAEDLHIHINTLHYRIKKFEQMTGLNLKQIEDLTNGYLALLFLDEQTKNNGI